eukprot:TRINITY_DN9833_c0_g1_i14.p1 TRINITY_DN9833_c0_g1~~TRINITY_DN9833_c0_g1_i14.p1  ORF type:complete len:125 (-),score=23.15 TRINITY_DN9833_c0_g1_i14:46-420(-)
MMEDLEKRVALLESTLNPPSEIGGVSMLEKRMQRMIGQHLSNLESRMTALIDSKVDSSDCYLQLKAKVNKTDFEKILAQMLILKKGHEEALANNKELSSNMKRIENNIMAVSYTHLTLPTICSV